MNSLSFVVLFAVAALTLAEVEVDHNGNDRKSMLVPRSVIHEVNLNRAFDRALPSIRSFITKHGFDPMEIPDIEIPLSHLPGLLKTKMILHRGHIQQLSTIYRTGDITMQYSEEKVSFYLNVGWETLDLSHEYSLRYMLFTRKGNCYGRYHDVEASILAEFDLKTHRIDLKFFKFVNVGKFDLKLEGHMIDGILNLLTKAVTKMFRSEVLRIIESKTYEEIDRTMQEINELIPSPMDFKLVAREMSPYKLDGLGQN